MAASFTFSHGSDVTLQNAIVAVNTLAGSGAGPDFFARPGDESSNPVSITSQSSLIGIGDDMGDTATFVDEGGNPLGTARARWTRCSARSPTTADLP